MQHLTLNRGCKQPGKKRRQAAVASALLLATLPLAISQAWAQQLTAVWDGSSNDGLFGTSANWNINQVPLNGGGMTYLVQIGPSALVNYKILNPQEIDGFSLDLNSTFNLTSTSVISPTALKVLGVATIGGSINANGASFSALASGTSLVGNTATLSAANGGMVAIGAASYSAAGLINRTILSAVGAGSALNLSSVQSFSSGSSANGGYTNTVLASDSGLIDLSSVKSVVAPGGTGGTEILLFSAQSGGTIKLSSLQTVSGLTPDSGYTKFSANGGTITLGPLQSANRMLVDLQGGSTMSLGGFAGSAALTNSTFAVSGGSALNAATLVGSLGVKGFINTLFLSADGSGSVLDMSSLQTVDSGTSANGGYTNTVQASNGGVINLAGVKSVIAPGGTGGTEILQFNALSGGSIDLSSLQTVSGLTTDSGYTKFSANGGTIALGPLQSANRMLVDLQGSSTMTLGGFAASAALSNSTFAVAGGSRLNAATLVGNLGVKGFINTLFLSADGSGSVLDLSGLQAIDSGTTANGGYTNTVQASSGGVIKLSGVKSLIAPGGTGGTEILQFNALSGGSIDLSSLQTASGLTTDSGYTKFSANGGTITLGPLQSTNRMLVDLQGGSTMSLGGFAGSATLTNSTFGVSGGSRLNAATLVGNLGVKGFINTLFLGADGNGSVLDLSGLQSVDSGTSANGGYTNTVQASNGGVIRLSGVKSVVAPGGSGGTEILLFNAPSGGSIDLASLQTVSGLTADSGYTKFAANGGTINVGPLSSANRMLVDLQGASTMNLGGFAGSAALTNSTFAVAGGSRLNAASLVGNLAVKGFINTTFLSADGNGSVLDLSGLQSIDSATTASGGYANSVQASNHGAIKLSGVTSVIAPAGSGGTQTLVFNAQTGGSIDLSSLQSITSPTSGQTQFNASGGGSILIHGIAAGAGVHFNLTNTDSTLTVAGSLSLLNGSTMSAGVGTHIDIVGNYSFQQTVESQASTDLATMAFGSSGVHTMEVGGRNIGTPTGSTVVQGNFSFGELDVGQATTMNRVQLVDVIDNGHGSPSEVLYLNGVNGGNGLHILDGSTLVLTDGLDLYTTENGQWKHINDLFQNGVTTIAYDQGFITTSVPEPGTVMLLVSGLGLVGARKWAWRVNPHV